MALSHIDGVAASGLSHIQGIAKASVAEILGQTASFGGSYDTDAQAFFTATGITDSTQKSAVNQLVLDLKSYSIWSKMLALWPFVGGSSGTHAVNLKTPGTFDITWHGTVTHNSNGVTGNGSTGYGSTGITPSTHLTVQDHHASVYCRTSDIPAGASRELGGHAASNNLFEVACRFANSNNSATLGSSSAIGVNAGTSQAYFIGTRRNSTDFELYRNTTSIGTNTGSAARDTSTNTVELNILARNANGTQDSYSSRNIALISIGTGLNATEAGNLYTAVQAYQTTLSRQI